MILNSYSELRKEDIRAMSQEELAEAVIRMFSIEPSKEFSGWYGNGFDSDELADAFRNRN